MKNLNKNDWDQMWYRTKEIEFVLNRIDSNHMKWPRTWNNIKFIKDKIQQVIGKRE